MEAVKSELFSLVERIGEVRRRKDTLERELRRIRASLRYHRAKGNEEAVVLMQQRLEGVRRECEAVKGELKDLIRKWKALRGME